MDTLNDAFIIACQNGDMKSAQHYVSQGANDFNQGFIIACNINHREIAEWLVTLGATDIDLGFITACDGNHREMANWLITVGANVNDFNIAFVYACYKNHHEMAKWLITLGANNFNGGFINAFKKNNIELCCWLLTHYSKEIIINILVSYPENRDFIVYCLKKGCSRALFSNIAKIEILWKKLDKKNQQWKQLIQPLEIKDLNDIIYEYFKKF